MPHYMFQGGYTPESWAKQIRSPQDRTVVIRQNIEGSGGRLESAYFAFGADDFVSIVEFPDNITAAALAIRIASSGALRNVRVTPLLTGEEMAAAEEKASGIGYSAPGEG